MGTATWMISDDGRERRTVTARDLLARTVLYKSVITAATMQRYAKRDLS